GAIVTGGSLLLLISGVMAASAGFSVSVVGTIQLSASYGGLTTASQDREMNRANLDTLQVSAGFYNALFAAYGGLLGGEKGIRAGATLGGITEGVFSLATLLRGPTYGPGIFPEPAGYASTSQWLQMSKEQRSLYDIGQLTLRDKAYEIFKDLPPIE